MKKITYQISLLLFITLSIFISNCTVDHLYTKDEFMALGEESDDSDNNNSNTELKEAQLVDPADEDNGLYTFSTVSIRKSNGELMFDGIDFNYNQPLNGTYNNADSGALSSGYFRVVHNGINIINGLGLTPVAKDLTTPVSPPSDQIYIDPEKGIFILPRPAYWSKCEDYDNIINGEIGVGKWTNVSSISSTNNTNYAKFGYCIYSIQAGMYIFEILDSELKIGTISLWLYTSGTNNQFLIELGNVTIVLGTNGTSIRINSLIVASGDNNQSTIGHFYIVFDKNNNLNSNKSIIAYKNGIELMSTDENIQPETTDIKCYIYSSVDYEGGCFLDNIKIWDYVVSEDPSFEYNNGNGREEALHPVYGQGNDYQPGIIQVGYFYK